jgi:hypothetical protein
MSSITKAGDTYHGISVAGRGVFKNKGGFTYAGQHRDGYACGLGVETWGDGAKVYAEHGPDGQYDGRNLRRFDIGITNYFLFERGEVKGRAVVSASGCRYNDEECAPDDPRLLALIAQVAPVMVRPAAPAPAPRPPSPPTRSQAIVRCAGSFCPRRRWRPPWPPRCTQISPPRRTPSLVAVRHSPTTAAIQSTTTQ